MLIFFENQLLLCNLLDTDRTSFCLKEWKIINFLINCFEQKATQHQNTNSTSLSCSFTKIVVNQRSKLQKNRLQERRSEIGNPYTACSHEFAIFFQHVTGTKPHDILLINDSFSSQTWAIFLPYRNYFDMSISILWPAGLLKVKRNQN